MRKTTFKQCYSFVVINLPAIQFMPNRVKKYAIPKDQNNSYTSILRHIEIGGCKIPDIFNLIFRFFRNSAEGYFWPVFLFLQYLLKVKSLFY
jgi:hypothetical protein